MRVEDLDRIIEEYKDVDTEEYINSEIERLMKTVYDGEHYYRNRLIDKILCGVFFAFALMFVAFFINPQSDIFLKVLIPLNFILTTITTLILLWNYFRIPKRFELFREIIENSIKEFINVHSIFSDKITKPYLRLQFDYNSLKNKNFNINDNEIEIKKYFLEMEDVGKELLDKYIDLHLNLQNEKLMQKPFQTDKFPRIQFFLDNFTFNYKYYVVTLTFFSIFLFVLYSFILNYWL